MDEAQAPAPEPQALNEAAVEANSVETSPVTEPTTSVETPVEAAPEVVEAVEDTERQQPRPAQRRIQQLVEENKQLRELTANPVAQLQSPQGPKLSEILQGRESIDPTELDKIGEQLVAQAANGLVDLKVTALEQKLVQKDAVNQLELDAQSLEREPELDPSSPFYNKALDKVITETWQRAAVKQNPYNPTQTVIDPSVRLADVAKGMLEIARASAETGKANAAESIAALADSAAIQPGVDVKEEKSFEDMSSKEMETYLRAKGYQI